MIGTLLYLGIGAGIIALGRKHDENGSWAKYKSYQRDHPILGALAMFATMLTWPIWVVVGIVQPARQKRIEQNKQRDERLSMLEARMTLCESKIDTAGEVREPVRH